MKPTLQQIIQSLSDNNIEEIEKSYKFFYFKKYEMDIYQQIFDILNRKDNLNSSENWMLGELYSNNIYLGNKNFNQALYYLELGANDGNTMALFSLGLLYHSSTRERTSYQKAKEYFELSAKQNNRYAQYSLGWMYFGGHDVDKDYEKAKSYFMLAIKQGFLALQI